MVIISNKLIKSSLKHYGVQGMKWGVRKDYKHVKKIYRITKNPNETNIPDGYFTTSSRQAKVFKEFVRDSERVPGTKIFNMTAKLGDVLITPSEKEEVEIQLELLKNKKVKDLWAMALTKHIEKATGYKYEVEYENYLKKRLEEYETPEAKKRLREDADYKERYYMDKEAYEQHKDSNEYFKKRTKESILSSITVSTNKESLQYFSMAVFGSPELRKIYRDIMLDKGYNAVEDRWGQNEVRSGKLASPSAIMILDKRIFKSVKVK